jgi:hypothetical protein
MVLGTWCLTFGDIYSYGILALKTVTGKWEEASASEFVEGLSIREYVKVSPA